MRNEIRNLLSWLHTWFGLCLGAILFTIFWMGSLTVFDQEIDQWMKPELRVAGPIDVSIDDLATPLIKHVPERTEFINILPPIERRNTLSIGYYDPARGWVDLHIDPHTGESLAPTDSLAGSNFIHPFHTMLHISWSGIGYWIVGFAGIAMITLLITGTLIHKKIFSDFFTFRPRKALRRSILDMHNILGVIGLPFNFMIALSGVFYYILLYAPLWAVELPYHGTNSSYDPASSAVRAIPLQGEPLESFASIDAMVGKAEVVWSKRSGYSIDAYRIRVEAPFDAGALVVIDQKHSSRDVGMYPYRMTFEGETGVLLQDYSRDLPVYSAGEWLKGMHLIQFDHWPLRWLYFFGGLAGCGLILSGGLFWIRAKTRTDGSRPLQVLIIRPLIIGSSTGLVIATGVFLVVNRAFDIAPYLQGLDQSTIEVAAFFASWISSYAHAAFRRDNAWLDQLIMIAAICSLAVGLNWLTTGDHILAALRNELWAIAGMDCVLLVGAATAVWVTKRLRATHQKTEASFSKLALSTESTRNEQQGG